MKIKLAEALLRRKELNDKVAVLKNIKLNALFEVTGKRSKITDGIDDIVLQVPKLTASQVTRELDWHSRQLRLIDAVIQQANWVTEVTVDKDTMAEYVEPTR